MVPFSFSGKNRNGFCFAALYNTVVLFLLPLRPPVCSSLRVHHISPIVSMGPHGVQFHENLPVMLVLPLSIEPSDEEWISCLYSNTEAGCQPSWERLPRKDYSYRSVSESI